MTEMSIELPEESHKPPLWQATPARKVLAAALAVGLGLRLFMPGGGALTPLDAATVLAAHEQALAGSPYPLYLALVRGLVAAGFGASPWLMRLLPAVLGLITIALCYTLGRLMRGPAAGAAAAVVVACMPALVAAAQPVHPASLMPVALLALACAAVSARTTNRWEWWLLYALALAAALYAGPHAALWCLAVFAWLIVTAWGEARLGRTLAATLGGALLYAPHAVRLAQYAPAAPEPGGAMAFESHVLAWWQGATLPAWPGGVWTAAALGAVGAGCAIGWLAASRRSWRNGLLAPVVLAAAVFGSYDLAQSGYDVAHAAATGTAAIVAVLLGVGAAWLPWRGGRVAITGLCCGLFITGLGAMWVQSPQAAAQTGAAVQELAQVMAGHWREGDVALHIGDDTLFPALVAAPQTPAVARTGPGGQAATGNLAPLYAWPVADEDAAAVASRFDRVWLWTSAAVSRETGQAARSAALVLDAKAYETARFTAGPVHLMRYEKRVDGRWTRPAGRDLDAGCTYETAYDNGTVTAYAKAHAVYGDSAGCGPLFLAFETVAADAGLIPLDVDDPGPPVGFVLTNDGDTAIDAALCVAASEWIVDLASLDDVTPEGPGWRTVPLRTGKSLGGGWHLPSAAARLSPELHQTNALGGFSLRAGMYYVYVYEHTPLPRGEGRDPAVSLVINDTVVFRSDERQAEVAGTWQWTPGRAMALPRDDGWVPMQMRAVLPGGAPSGQAHLAYAVLARVVPGRKAADQLPRHLYGGAIRIAPGESRRYTVQPPADARRLDVWVFDLAPDGKAHRIFRRLDAP